MIIRADAKASDNGSPVCADESPTHTDGEIRYGMNECRRWKATDSEFNDLFTRRHRRVSLLHLAGTPWARIGELVGHDDLMTTASTYTHVVTDERELDYGQLLETK
jgi:integrase